MRLILADDHNLFREALCYYLRQASSNVELLEAANLDDALHLAGDGRTIDAMLLDYIMPGMDGSAGIRRVKQTLPDVPLVVLSGNISDE